MTAPVDHGASLTQQTDPVAVTPSHRRLTFLDSVRGIAALAVLMQHLGSDSIPGFDAWSRLQFDMGQFGVVAFFLVSGFIIPVSLQKYGKLSSFWRGRAFRLYPMYWLSLALTLIVGYAGRLPLETAFLQHPLLNSLANVTMLQRFVGLSDANGVYWTLALELVFYALCSILFWRKWLQRPVAIAIAASISLAVLNPVMAFGFHIPPPAMHLSLVLTAFVGTVAYQVHKQALPRTALALVLPIAFIPIAEGFWIRYAMLPVEPGKMPITFLAMILAWIAGYALFFLFFALKPLQFPRWMQWLGEISYSVYLLHLVVMYVIPPSLGAGWFLGCIAATLGLSHLTYRYIERPAMKLNPS